jgi:hypothetical protein
MFKSRGRAFVAGLVIAVAALAVPTTQPATALEPVATSMTLTFGVFNSASAELTRGDTLTVSGVLRAGSTPVGSATVQLWAKPYASTWRKIGSTTTSSSGGRARLTHKPVRNTWYQWRFLGTETHAASMSAAGIAKVHVTVSMHLEDSTIRAGQRVAARGFVRPPKPGIYATLWLYGPGTRSKLAKSLIRSDGSYRITKALSHGSKSLYVTVPAASGNLGGKSPSRSVTVN